MQIAQAINYIVIAALWSVWCLAHSLFITKTVTNFIENNIPFYHPYHRPDHVSLQRLIRL